jgi:hypothetical protein
MYVDTGLTIRRMSTFPPRHRYSSTIYQCIQLLFLGFQSSRDSYTSGFGRNIPLYTIVSSAYAWMWRGRSYHWTSWVDGVIDLAVFSSTSFLLPVMYTLAPFSARPITMAEGFRSVCHTRNVQRINKDLTDLFLSLYLHL